MLLWKVVESRAHIVGECEVYKKERDVLEMRKTNEFDMEKFGTLGSSEKTIGILEIGGHRRRNSRGIR